MAEGYDWSILTSHFYKQTKNASVITGAFFVCLFKLDLLEVSCTFLFRMLRICL